MPYYSSRFTCIFIALYTLRARTHVLALRVERGESGWESERVKESCRLHEVVSIFVYTICEWFACIRERACMHRCTEYSYFLCLEFFRTSGRYGIKDEGRRRKCSSGNGDNLYCFLKCTVLLEQRGRQVEIKGSYCLIDRRFLFR